MNRFLAFLIYMLSAAGDCQVITVPTGYQSAASESRVSPVLFYAMALTESGQSEMTAEFRPWPWTLSIDGEPHFYRSREEAVAALEDAIRRQVGQLGVGLFQVEYRFHSDRFPSPEAMLDPYENSRIAADILSESLERSGGDIWEAVGLFHSATPELAGAYRARVSHRLFDLVASWNQAE